MAKMQYYSKYRLVEFFLEQGKEGVCWDFKQEWHSKIEELIKDIICFANTVHDENCYLIFGVSDDLQIVGMKEKRRKQADIIDTISNLHFAGDIYPKISVDTITYNNVELDILTIYNSDETPIYLKKQYGAMKAGCIYIRTKDKNTPDNGNADIGDIEQLWKKRLGLTKSPLEYIYDRMHNKLEWTENGNYFYNKYKPEYTIEIVNEDEDRMKDNHEFYSYAMVNERTTFETLHIKYQQTVLESYEIVYLDGGRLCIPTPKWGFVCHDDSFDNRYSYKYYVAGSKRGRILTFLYDPNNQEQRYAFSNLRDVVLFYNSEEERLAFETYLEANQSLVKEQLEQIDRYDYIKVENEHITELYKIRLHTGIALNQLLDNWRKSKKHKE